MITPLLWANLFATVGAHAAVAEVGAIVSPAWALYIDPGSGSMLLQLLLGGVSGLYVIRRLLQQRILCLLGIRKEESIPPRDTAERDFHSRRPG